MSVVKNRIGQYNFLLKRRFSDVKIIFTHCDNFKLIFSDIIQYLERTVELIVAVDLTLALVFMISRYHYI